MPDSPSADDLAALLEVPAGEVAFLDRLDREDLTRLHEVVAATLEREGRAIDEALEATVRFLPRPLRGRAKKLLFPGER